MSYALFVTAIPYLISDFGGITKLFQQPDIIYVAGRMNNAKGTLESRRCCFLYFPLTPQIGGYKDVPDSEAVPRMARLSGIVRQKYLYGKY